MKKAPEKSKTSTKKAADPEMEGPFAEKDEVKKAETRMRKAAQKPAK